MNKTKIARIIFMISIIFASLTLTWKFCSKVIAYESVIPKSAISANIGYTAGYYTLKGGRGIYCVDHGNGLSANDYSLVKRIEISGNTATGYTGSNSTADYTWTCIENGALAYILGHYTTNEKSWAHATGYWYGNSVSNRQRSLWRYWNTWCTNGNNQIKKEYNRSGTFNYLPYTADGNGSYNENYETTENGETYNDGGETHDSDGNDLAYLNCGYAENYANAENSGYGYDGLLENGIAKITSCSPESITSEYSSGIIGPISVRCNNAVNSDGARIGGNTSIYSITGNNGVTLQACNRDGTSYTGDTFDGETYTGLQTFYLKVTSGSIYDLTEITISALNKKTLTVEIHIWETEAADKQRLISVYTGTTTTYDSVKINVDIQEPKVNIVVNKYKTGTTTGIEDIGFTVINKDKKDAGESAYYVKASGEYTSIKTIIYTNSSGQITINDIELYSGTSDEFTVTEAGSKNRYYNINTSNTSTKAIQAEGTRDLYLL